MRHNRRQQDIPVGTRQPPRPVAIISIINSHEIKELEKTFGIFGSAATDHSVSSKRKAFVDKYLRCIVE